MERGHLRGVVQKTSRRKTMGLLSDKCFHEMEMLLSVRFKMAATGYVWALSVGDGAGLSEELIS